MNVDRVIHAKQHVSKLPSSDRFLAIAWPENLDTNAHLHVAADLRGFAARVGGIDPTALGKIWHRASRGAGSVHVQDMTSRGWASYITKKASGADPLYFISTDFHPN